MSLSLSVSPTRSSVCVLLVMIVLFGGCEQRMSGSGADTKTGSVQPTKPVAGTYVYLELSQSSITALRSWCMENGIPNPLAESDYHITLVNSDAPIRVVKHPPAAASAQEFVLATYSESDPLTIYHHTYSLSVWRTKHNTQCLVLNMVSEELTARHMMARAAGAKHEWEKWECHMTLSYDLNTTATNTDSAANTNANANANGSSDSKKSKPSAAAAASAKSKSPAASKSPTAAAPQSGGDEIADRIRTRKLKPPAFDICVVAEVERPRVENWAQSLTHIAATTGGGGATSPAAASGGASKKRTK